ncbi:MAG: ATP-dependent helicase RecG [Thermomicrobiales bacterium]|nr:ATP-dependent helicase RecG [Thermomicrobiales bacterium]
MWKRIRQRVRTIDRRSQPSLVASGSADLVDSAIEALRREWRTGCAGSMARLATAYVRRLNTLAVSHEAGLRLARIETQLQDYQRLPVDQRRQALPPLAEELKSVKPLLSAAEEPIVPVGKLNSAVAPGRQPKVETRATAKPQTPSVKPLPPDAPVTSLPRVGDAVAKKLANLGVKTVGDLLRLGPRRHIDYSRTVKIGAALGFGPRDEVTVRGEIVELKAIPGPPARVHVRLADETGSLKITWFNSFIAKQLQVGEEIAVSGKLDSGYGSLSFTNPEWEKMGGPALSTGRLTPVYPLTQGLAQKTMRGLTRAALDATKTNVVDFLPPPIRDRHQLTSLVAAYEGLHYPADHSTLASAQKRLAFDDLFLLQIGLIRRKRERQAVGGIALPIDKFLLDRFLAELPFALTGAQRRALDEILGDLQRALPMARLLQGDVGSGKTVVAAAAALVTIAQSYQTAVMAPTEILAEQHYHNFRGLYASLDTADRPTVALLTGSTRAAERREILAALAEGDVDVLVGTHAIIQEGVEIPRLGLAVVDEQHRFGVRQRGALPARAAGPQPHLLSMTATPIPRTLNMVLNGDLDVSVIGELPPGRIPIETRRFVGPERQTAYELVRAEIAKGHQVFVICPLVEESEATEAKAAVAEAQRLKAEVFPDLEIEVLHGRMSGRDKDRIMTTFRDREADILVSTSVIEVGIDVPNATVMLVEGADRFGLAQLHQFRGRVGRGGSRSYCLLLADEASPEAEARLQMMVETNDGFVLAEKDLELRGPGDFIGTRQSGLPEMTWLDGSFDTRLLDQARQAAEALLDADPELRRPEHHALDLRYTTFWQTASPDVPVS